MSAFSYPAPTAAVRTRREATAACAATVSGCRTAPAQVKRKNCLWENFSWNLVNGDCACSDVDECADVSQCPGQMCVNTVGSYRCVSCRAGYTLLNRQCTGALMNQSHLKKPHVYNVCTCNQCPSVSADINECEAGDPCPGQQCANTEGSYSCVSCQQGYQTVNGKCAGERARTCAGKIQPHPKHFFLVHFQTMLDLKIDSDETTDVQHILRPYLLWSAFI